jgi:acetyltransferase-like isoleucine patch superfamily enzyme
MYSELGLNRLEGSVDLVPPPGFVVRGDDLPSWWTDNGNALWTLPGMSLPQLQLHHGDIPSPKSALFIIGSSCPTMTIVAWGERPTIIIGQGCLLPNSIIQCGSAMVALGDGISSAPQATLDARNGGLIHVGSGGLWSGSVRMMTDDMHAIRDQKTRERLNKRGGTIAVGEHVWLGLEVLLLGGTDIGRDSIIGARSVVTQAVPPNCIAAGVPAKLIKQGVTWSHDDDP